MGILISMAGGSNLIERYLRALVLLHDPQAHDTRGALYNVDLQLGLIAEILDRADLTDPKALAKLKGFAENARAGFREVKETIEGILSQTDFGPRPTVDVGRVLRDVGALIGPLLKTRGLNWRLTAPEVPVPLDVDRVAFWQTIVVAAVEGAETMQPSGNFEIALDVTGRWTMTGPRQGEWVDILRQMVESHGGELLAGPTRVEVRMPTGVRR
jgi:hypothetical protein